MDVILRAWSPAASPLSCSWRLFSHFVVTGLGHADLLTEVIGSWGFPAAEHLVLNVLIEKIEDIVFPCRNVFVQHIVAVV